MTETAPGRDHGLVDVADLPRKLIYPYACLYGTWARDLLGSSRVSADLDRHFGGDFYQREAVYLRENEWAAKAADFVERRTKHGLHLTRAQQDAFAAYVGS